MRRLAARLAAGAGALALTLGAATPAAGVAVPLAAPAPATLVAPAATDPGRAATTTGGSTITVSGLTPGTLEPGAMLTVTGRVRNTTRTTLGAVSVDVRIRPERLRNRAAVDAWAAGRGEEFPGKVVVTATLPGRLAPGAVATFTARKPVDESFGLPGESASFGPRGVTVELVGAVVPAGTPADADAGLRRAVVGTQRTFTVWSPKAAPPTLRLGVLVPLVQTRPPDGAASDLQTLEDLSATGRIGRLTRIAASTPGLTWAVDPALLLAAHRAGSSDRPGDEAPAGPTAARTPDIDSTAPPTGGAARPGLVPAAGGTGSTPDAVGDRLPGARQWLATIKKSIDSQEVRALPFGDPDLTAIARSKQSALLTAALAAGDDAARTALGTDLPQGLGWPVDGFADRATADLVAGTGLTDLVLAGAAQPSTGPQGITPLPHSNIATTEGTVNGLVADDVMSSAFAAAGLGGDALAQQRLVADLAATARESLDDGAPPTGRSVLVVAPRDWPVDGSSLSTVLATLRGTSWLTVTPATGLRAEPADRTSGPDLVYPATARRAELDAGVLRLVASARWRLARFAPVIPDPDPVVRPLEQEALSLAGSAWRTDPERFDARARALDRTVDRFYGGVRVAVGSSKNLLAQTGDLPLTVQNDLDVTVQVVVALRPRSLRLVVDKPVPVTVGPRARTTALVPVRANANGDVDVGVTLLTPTLEQITTPMTIPVRVRSDWENRGIAVVGGGLVLLLVVGLARGVRRGRRPSVPLDTVPDPDDVGRVLVDDTGRVLAEGADARTALDLVQRDGAR